MNIYLISQTKNKGYDTYDSAVVVANDATEASKIHPSGDDGNWNHDYGSWCSKPEDVKVILIGMTPANVCVGVILASFNAG